MENFIVTLLDGFPTIVLILAIAVLFWTLGKGADIVVDESVKLSLRWGVPKLVVGATIVSLGTTLPEATISVLAAVKGVPGLALGNAIGSIITDTGLIMGLAVIIGVVPTVGKTVSRQGWIQLIVGFMLAITCLPFTGFSNGGRIYQFVGFIYVLLLVLYIFFSVKWARKTDAVSVDEDCSHDSVVLLFVKLVFGIALVIISSRILIPAIMIVATRAHVPEGVIAATLVAFGTSLPELVTAVVAVKKGHGQLAIGNVIGADILNVLFVVGLSAAVTREGLAVPTSFYMVQIPFMLLILTTFKISVEVSKEKLGKMSGILLLGFYVLYLVLSFVL